MTVEVRDGRVEWTDNLGDYLIVEYPKGVARYVELEVGCEAWTQVPREEWRQWLQAALAALDDD